MDHIFFTFFLWLEKADGRTWKKHNLKFWHIGYNVDPYGQSFFPKCISAWNGLAQEIAEANTLDVFKSKLARVGRWHLPAVFAIGVYR